MCPIGADFKHPLVPETPGISTSWQGLVNHARQGLVNHAGKSSAG
jgi:hypothetical protein